MPSNSLLVRRDNNVVIATLNRPNQLNALSKDLFDDLKSLLDVLETDKTARAVILTGAGDKAFCVGADLKERQGMNEKDILHRMDFVHKLYLRIEALSMPVIAAINGTALGGGLEIALACDLRVAVETATIGLPEVDLAIIPGNGGTQRLARLMGAAKAMELIFLARKLPASDALKLGILNSVVPVGQSVATALQWTAKMMESGPLALKQAKKAIRLGIERKLEEGLQIELDAYKACLYSKDRLEGVKSFIEKRKPVYRGE